MWIRGISVQVPEGGQGKEEVGKFDRKLICGLVAYSYLLRILLFKRAIN